jgi:hypothetical protein
MGLFDKFRGDDESDDGGGDFSIEFSGNPPPLGGSTVDETESAVIQLRGERYPGEGVRSQNGDYILIWTAGQRVQISEGDNDGKFYLAHNDQLLLQGDIPAPFLGAVADNGTFALVNSPPDPQSSSSFYVFTASGERVITDSFEESNIGPIAITADGSYTATTTLVPDEGGYIYDVGENERICRFVQNIHPDSLSFVKESGEWVLKVNQSNSKKKISLEGESI